MRAHTNAHKRKHTRALLSDHALGASLTRRDDLGVGTALEGSAITSPPLGDGDEEEEEEEREETGGADGGDGGGEAAPTTARKKKAEAARDEEEGGIEMTNAAIRGAPPAPSPQARSWFG